MQNVWHEGQCPAVFRPLLSVIVLHGLSTKFKEGLPIELLYADDLVLIAETEALLVEKIQKRRKSTKKKVLKSKQRL